ncbi:RHS repeat domain-containing protein [Morganella morganii]|uniref:RHS repeat domain-containing protein n=1 Tax=Morganella morganii TaxID=582 RepID=UPI0031386926
MNRPLFSKTPTVSVFDNRGLVVRNIAYHRHPDVPEVTNERITRHGYDARGFLMQSTDPRLHDNELVNFSYLTNLAGGVLRTQSTDNGTIVSLNDSAGRPFIVVSNISTAGDGTEDRSSAVTRTRQYDNAGRPVKVTEQVGDQSGRITERFVYAGHTDAEKALNLAGTCISHYDTAGLVQTDSIALTGVPLSVTRRLLKNADSTDTVADWQGEDVSVWNDLPDNEAYITLTTADSTGSVLTTTDAQGNMQRMAYDVAGLLSGSWLTVKGDTEKVIVASLTYSAAGQKLREKHGNGVITTYTYEPETQRLIGIKTERPAGHVQGVKVLQDLRYTYDAVGNVLNITNDAEETRFWHNQKVVPENTYVYDSLYQLVSATGREMANAGKQGCSLPPATVPLPADNSAYTNYTRTYTYDNAGNLTQIRHTPATGSGYTIKITVSDRSNRGVLSTLAENPSDVDALFTAGGQQVQLQKGQDLFWTPRNELLKVTPVTREGETGDRESYRYDTNSRRLLKISVQKTGNSTQTQRVLYLPGLELRTTKAGSTETEKLQVITAGEAGRAQVRMLHWESGRPDKITGDQIRYSYDNLIGSSCLELDGAGNIISMEEYYPYGGTAVRTARNTVEADYKIIRYSGKERDATGLYYYGYRYYQPWAGRWLSADPAGTVDGLNLFRMVQNNPVTLYDDNGLAPSDNIYSRVLKAGFSGNEEEMFMIMARPQSLKKQRKIAGQTENEAKTLMEGKDQNTLKIVRDYTTDSSQVNTGIRSGAGFSKVKDFDEALNLLSDGQRRITYRVTTYLDGNSPWDSGNNSHIAEGDIVKDTTYLSTSAHRGFLTYKNKKENAGTKYARFAIISDSSVNVSGLSKYNNEAERQIFEMENNLPGKSVLEKVRSKIKGPESGQAEYLIPRGINFRIDKIKNENNNAYILMTEVSHPGKVIKNIYSGAPVTH